jgi:hypothetical protein
MNTPLFADGITGLSDTKWSGSKGNAYRLVGVDFRSEPGVIKAQQKLKKISGSTITELCKVSLDVSDGSKLWFSSESGKIWRQVNDTFTLIHTIAPLTDYKEPDVIEDAQSTLAITNTTDAWSDGITLNPSGNAFPELVAMAMTSASGSGASISTAITVPNETNMYAVVFAGSYNDVSILNYPTFDANNMTTISERQGTSAGFNMGERASGYLNPLPGSRTVSASFGSSVANRFLVIMIFKNVNQTTPFVVGSGDSGWKNFTYNPGTINYQLRVALFATLYGTHTHSDLQNKILERAVSGSTPFGTISVATRGFYAGVAKTLGASEFSYIQNAQTANVNNSYEYLSEQVKSKIYYANDGVLFAVPIDKLTAWASNIESVGSFKYADDTYHSMTKQNLELFIGDKYIISKVDVNGNFIQETSFNLKAPERIQTLSNFNIDILVGTKDINKSRVLRWDGNSDSWDAEDDVFENGINAFIKDDNYTYVSAGDYGRIYFYNGEKLDIFKRIPGIWDNSHKAIINENSTGFYQGIPVFGLSNSTGNSTLQGIYGLGGYDSKYVKALSLDYPLPSNEFSGVNIGSILVNGADMYVSYKTATDVGVARIDHNNKYNGAYIETMQITSIFERDENSVIERVIADYVSLPANTAVAIGNKTKYDTNYTDMTVITDADSMSIKTKNNIPKIASLQIKFTLTSNANDCPVIENFGIC